MRDADRVGVRFEAAQGAPGLAHRSPEISNCPVAPFRVLKRVKRARRARARHRAKCHDVRARRSVLRESVSSGAPSVRRYRPAELEENGVLLYGEMHVEEVRLEEAEKERRAARDVAALALREPVHRAWAGPRSHLPRQSS